MSGKYFGTDGIRGAAGGHLMNPSFLRRLGAALAGYLTENIPEAPHAAVIGRDTRASGGGFFTALRDGLCSRGFRVWDAGILPTPALALAASRLPAGLGLMVTASHNPASDNGVKVFTAEGYKLEDKAEERVEAWAEKIASVAEQPEAAHESYDGVSGYLDFIQSLAEDGCLRGRRIIADTAHGATAGTTPVLLERLGAEVIRLGDTPDGRNINAGAGSEYPEKMAAKTRAEGAWLGLAHDGDGDRVVFADETGSVLDGDEVLGLMSLHMLRAGKLARNTLVATIQSNLGLDEALESAGGRVERAPVGDRCVIRRLRKGGYSFGGEPSGHFIFHEQARAGDGLLAALKVMEVMRETGQPLSMLRRGVRLFPQAKTNLRVKEKIPFGEMPGFEDEIAALEKTLPGRGRILARYSGTEPKIRLLTEGEDHAAVEPAMKQLVQLVEKHLQTV